MKALQIFCHFADRLVHDAPQGCDILFAGLALSYLGVGIQPPGAAWGSMIQQGTAYLTIDPILALVPGVVIMLVVYAFNLFGDGLRDALDPRLRGSI